MLSKEDNELITRVGPGTPMGELFRRYWIPACLTEEVAIVEGPPVRVRLLGEDLVAFRDSDGQVGLIDEHCPHRGASLYFGRNEDCGLRCVYHGWQYDRDGNCIDMPSEPPTSTFKSKVKAAAYPVHESGGIVWTYMGPPEKMTPFRDFGSEGLEPQYTRATKLYTPCNYLQAMEGNMDTAHISWLHQFDMADLPLDEEADRPGYPTNALSWRIWAHDRAPRLDVEETWYGYKYVGIRTTPKGHTHVRMSAFVFPFHTLVATIPWGAMNGMFVPADDTHCWRYTVSTRRPNPDMSTGGPTLFELSPYEFVAGTRTGGILERPYTASNDYGIDRDEQRSGKTFSGVREFISQDFMVTESMGPIYDRTKERLGTTDRSIIKLRRLLIDAAKTVAAGGEPPAVVGDFRDIRSAEKILDEGEDWRILGTADDPMVQQFDPVYEPLAATD